MTYLKTLPEVIWSNQLQSNTVKMFMTNGIIQFHKETLNNQNEAESQENKFDWLLYTDASVDLHSEPPGKVSIGYIWYKKESGKWRTIVCKSMLIWCMYSSFSAEAIAMTEGLMNQTFQAIPADQNSKEVNVGIFTDSLSNIKNLNKGIITAPEQQELAKILQETPIETTIHHTRSNIGITRNEEVDRLCSVTNQDPNRTATHRDGALTKSKVKEWVKKEMKQLRWQKLYKKRTSADKTPKYFLSVLGDKKEVPKEHKHLPRHESVLLSKARTFRWTQCNYFRARMNGFNKDATKVQCDFCHNDKPDTTEHQIDECQRHIDKRQIMLQKLQHKYINVSSMLCTTDHKELNLLISFLIDIENSNGDGYDGTSNSQSSSQDMSITPTQRI